MSERDDLLASITETVRDYQYGQNDPPSHSHVDRWISQFDSEVQVPMLHEMNHVLKRTYYSREAVTSFLHKRILSDTPVATKHCAFWRSIRLLNIQLGGTSQSEMLALLDDLLLQNCNFGVEQCGIGDCTKFMYLDDVIFTGNRVLNDIRKWIEVTRPIKATLCIATIVSHMGGRHYAQQNIARAAAEAGSSIDVEWWSDIDLEDRRLFINDADVLVPTSIPDDTDVINYVANMQYSPTLRQGTSLGTKSFFKTPKGRALLEQEFLRAGVRIRRMNHNLSVYQRPLGHSRLDTLGFGSLIVTFRNCPNNAPLALWAGYPWYPLFPRINNSQRSNRRYF